jgi:hypothetical protein
MGCPELKAPFPLVGLTRIREGDPSPVRPNPTISALLPHFRVKHVRHRTPIRLGGMLTGSIVY